MIFLIQSILATKKLANNCEASCGSTALFEYLHLDLNKENIVRSYQREFSLSKHC